MSAIKLLICCVGVAILLIFYLQNFNVTAVWFKKKSLSRHRRKNIFFFVIDFFD